MAATPSSFKQNVKQLVKNNKLLYYVTQVIRGKKKIAPATQKNISGKDNKIDIAATAALVNCKLEINGDNNIIQIAGFGTFNNVTFHISGSNHKLTIGEGAEFRRGGVIWMEDNNGMLVIGSKSTFQNVHLAVTEPGSQLLIGNNCMFAYDIDIRTGDSHSIIDTASGQRINRAKNVIIDDHVWVGAHSTILKGVHLKANTIVATRSVVTKSFDAGSIVIGGSPAKVLRSGVSWVRERL